MSAKRRHKKIITVPRVILVGILVFVGIRMAMLDTKINLNLDYVAPGVDFENINPQIGEQWAVALNGKIISRSEEMEPRPIASTAKTILALAVMEKKPFSLGEFGEMITISEEMYNNYAWYNANGGSTSVVEVGEEISEYDALASALIVSSNNMADTLAIWAFGSLEEYKNYATEMVVRLGAIRTTIGPDASGFDSATTSTAEDLAVISEAVLRQPVLAEIVGRTEAEVPVAGKIENTNKLLGDNGIIGVKTGYNGDSSGYCLTSGYKEGEEIITVTLLGATDRQSSFHNTNSLVTEAQAKVKTRELVEPGEEVGHYSAWWTKNVPIVAEQGVSGVAVSEVKSELDEGEKILKISTAETEYEAPLKVEDFPKEPTLWQRLLRVFGWKMQ